MSDFSDSSIVVDAGDDEHNEQTDGSVVIVNQKAVKNVPNKRVRKPKRTISTKSIDELMLLPFTTGRASCWKGRFVSDIAAKKYVKLLRQTLCTQFVLFRYYCIVDNCRAEFTLPTHAGVCSEHLQIYHPAEYAIIESTDANISADKSNRQRSIIDFTNASYKRSHPKYVLDENNNTIPLLSDSLNSCQS